MSDTPTKVVLSLLDDSCKQKITNERETDRKHVYQLEQGDEQFIVGQLSTETTQKNIADTISIKKATLISSVTKSM